MKETPEERWERIQQEAKLSTHLRSAEVESVKNILWERASCFSDQPGTYKGVELKIDTGNARPVSSRGYRNPKLSDPAFRQQILEWEDIGIVEKSTSAWAAPVLVVPKKSGAFRTVIDFRGLNKLLAKEENPIPRVMDVLDTLGGTKYVTSLDLTSGYYQLSVREEDRHKTAFTTPWGLWQFRKVPQGISNVVPTTFQRTMEHLLRGLVGTSCLCFLDDILIHSATFEQHLKDVDQVLERIQTAGMTLRLSKCRFFDREVEYLGHLISGDGGSVCTDKVEAVKSFPRPTGVTGVRSFLGIANFYRRFF